MTPRENWEQKEIQILAPYATFSTSAVRIIPEEKCSLRTDFQRDRDRIIHSKAFRRLKHKTQVFLSPNVDHHRTRLTHTLEVSQIARTIARALNLNEDLTEAISLGHDLGHTPFGHAGEDVLNKACPHGFKHAEQSVRVVDKLERGGLNLTEQVRDGILNHTGSNIASTLEGRIVKFADRIAYVNHDIDDAVRAGILTVDMLPKSCIDVLGETHSKRINCLINAVVETSLGKNIVEMNPKIEQEMLKLREFMFKNVYNIVTGNIHCQNAEVVVTTLYNRYISNPNLIPENLRSNDIHRSACDYVAGMTDNFAIREFEPE